jgi:hypothetical protein
MRYTVVRMSDEVCGVDGDVGAPRAWLMQRYTSST